MNNLEPYLPYMLQLLKRLVETESPSNDKSAVDRVGKLFEDELRSIGAEVQVIQNQTAGNHLIAKFQVNSQEAIKGKENGFLLLCHMDTVYPIGTIKSMPFQEKDGRLMGPGVADMKSGGVISLAAIKYLIDNDLFTSLPVSILFTSDEEIGSGTSKKWIEELALKSSIVLVLEPGMPDGSIKIWRKGVGGFHIEIGGKAAHAGGDHANGRNAIEELANQVIRIQKLTDYSLGTTLNVGVAEGGTVSNVVPDHAWMDVDLRVKVPEEADRIVNEINQLTPVLDGTTMRITGGMNRPPMPYDDMMENTFSKAVDIANSIGIQLKGMGTGGAS
ncbi:MAG: M20 family metallopeptidase, partial [Anaerolineales bacterium]